MPKQRYAIGIDLGTTFSSLAYVDDQGRVDALRLPDGSFTLASLVYFKSSQEVVIGNEALNFSVLAPERMARAFKRHMADPKFDFQVDGKHFRPEELSAMVLKKLLEAAREQLGPIERAVISVPFVFDEARRQATQAAGKIAGLEVFDIVDEPVAAALSYGHKLQQTGKFFTYSIDKVYADETILVYDLGGGTFDATVMRMGNDGKFEVVATDGDERLGGEDWDNILLEIVLEQFQRAAHFDPRSNKPLMQELRLKTVEAKKTLSERPRAEMTFSQAGKKYSFSIARGDFEKNSENLLARTEHTLEDMLARKDLTWSHIDRVLLVGGSSRMPMVRKMISRVTKRPQDMSLPPDMAIATGAALYAAFRSGSAGLPVKDIKTVNSHPLGLEARDPRTNKHMNDLLLKANEPTLKRVTRSYIIRRGLEAVKLPILLGDSTDPEACVLLGLGRITKLPPNLQPTDRMEVSFCFQENGLLQVEGVIRRADGKTAGKIQFEVEVEGKMSLKELASATTTLRGIQLY